LEIRNGLVRGSQLQVINAKDNVGTKKIRPVTQGPGQFPYGEGVLPKAVIGKAEVDPGFNQVGVYSEDFVIFFRRTVKLP
jgi:hypothetical protein